MSKIVEKDNSVYIINDRFGKCTICGSSTQQVEIYYETWICSKICQDEMDRGYTESFLRSGENV